MATTLVVLTDQNIGTMVGEAVAQLLGNEVAELLLHRVHKSLGEIDLSAVRHSLQLLHVLGELAVLR